MKKVFSLVLCLLLALPPFSAPAGMPGETAEVSFSMLSNPGSAYVIEMALEYDHDVLELLPNNIFDRDEKMALFNENLSAVFHIREGARPGEYPVTIRVAAASDNKGNLVDPPIYSGAAVTVDPSPVEVPVYYIDAATGGLLTADSVILPAGRTSTVTAQAPEGWTVPVGQSIQVTVSEDGQAMPPVITFWLSAATPAPTAAPAPTPVPVNVVEYVTFGHYEQDNDTGNGKEPIEWLVLEVNGDQALVISKYGLDVQPYNTSREDVTWETSSLRKWLNGEFLNDAFNPEEQKAIIMTTVDNSAGQRSRFLNTSGGKNTEDKVFLLSYAEAGRYFGGNSARQCQATSFAAGRGAYTSGGSCRGWLRSPGYNQCFAAAVVTDGSLNYYFVNRCDVCVRPALWVNLDSGIF